MSDPCPHVDEIKNVAPRTPEGCGECLATRGRWVQLRLCLTCGHVGCCDSSPGKHATTHFRKTRHPLIRSFEPGGDWAYCYVDDLTFEPAIA
jgi:uncharacterized UBP type Zn finger protein